MNRPKRPRCQFCGKLLIDEGGIFQNEKGECACAKCIVGRVLRHASDVAKDGSAEGFEIKKPSGEQ